MEAFVYNEMGYSCYLISDINWADLQLVNNSRCTALLTYVQVTHETFDKRQHVKKLKDYTGLPVILGTLCLGVTWRGVETECEVAK